MTFSSPLGLNGLRGSQTLTEEMLCTVSHQQGLQLSTALEQARGGGGGCTGAGALGGCTGAGALGGCMGPGALGGCTVHRLSSCGRACVHFPQV